MASVAAVEDMVGAPVDPLRFRGNLHVTGLPAFAELDLVGALRSPAVSLLLVRERGRLVAVGRRYSADGASYLSSIGTEPLARGRGHATLVTRTLAADAREGGDEFAYLAVHVGNERAIDVYRRSGFEVVGDRAGDYLLS